MRRRRLRTGATILAALTASASAGVATASAAPRPGRVLGAAPASVGAAAADPPTLWPPACADPVASWPVPARLAQLLLVVTPFSDLASAAPEVVGGAGGLVLSGQGAAGSGPAIASGIATLQAEASGAGDVAPWVSTDEEGGLVARLSAVIGTLPSPRQMADAWSPAQITSALAGHGAAMRSLGITMDLAPVLDTASPTNTIADESDRSFSDNPQTVAADGLAFVRGLEAGGVVAVGKHFPGLGHASANTDLGPATDPSLAQLEHSDLLPFEQAAAAGLPVMMVSHAIVPGLTGGLPASLSPATYSFLRRNVGFAGVAITDSLAAGAISAAGYSEQAAAVTAVEAGADMAMVDAGSWSAALTSLEQAVTSGALPLSQVDASVGRILAAKGLSSCPSVAMSSVPGGTGYRIAGSGGAVRSFGSAADEGSVTGLHLYRPIVGMAATADGRGYWQVASDGGIFTFGDAAFYGSMGGKPLNQPIDGMAATPDGGGYWEVAADGGIFTFGDGRFYGSKGGQPLNAPMVGMAATPDGRGYWEVAADGGIFTFGDAGFYGSMGGKPLNQPIVAMTATPDGRGYWEVAADGGIFTFGDAGFYGSMGGKPLNQPIVAMAATPDGRGYWEVAADGGIFTFGDAAFYGSGA